MNKVDSIIKCQNEIKELIELKNKYQIDLFKINNDPNIANDKLLIIKQTFIEVTLPQIETMIDDINEYINELIGANS